MMIGETGMEWNGVTCIQNKQQTPCGVFWVTTGNKITCYFSPVCCSICLRARTIAGDVATNVVIKEKRGYLQHRCDCAGLMKLCCNLPLKWRIKRTDFIYTYIYQNVRVTVLVGLKKDNKLNDLIMLVISSSWNWLSSLSWRLWRLWHFAKRRFTNTSGELSVADGTLSNKLGNFIVFI